jgi:hypothetical protein
VAFTSYGAFWLSFAAYVKFIAPGLPTADAATATGLFLLGWTIFTAYMTTASLRTTGAVAAAFVVVLATFVLLVIGELGGSAGAGRIGGYLGILTAVLVWYASAAGVVNATWKRTLFPVLPLGYWHGTHGRRPCPYRRCVQCPRPLASTVTRATGQSRPVCREAPGGHERPWLIPDRR